MGGGEDTGLGQACEKLNTNPVVGETMMVIRYGAPWNQRYFVDWDSINIQVVNFPDLERQRKVIQAWQIRFTDV